MSVLLIEFEQDDGCGKHDNGHEYRGDGRRQDGALAIDCLQHGQGDEARVGHRRRHAIHGSACQSAGTAKADDAEHEKEAEERTAAEGNEEAPVNQGMAVLLRNGHDQQRGHGDVVGETYQRVRRGARQIARRANDPAS